jgi:hypothetical protein
MPPRKKNKNATKKKNKNATNLQLTHHVCFNQQLKITSIIITVIIYDS